MKSLRSLLCLLLAALVLTVGLSAAPSAAPVPLEPVSAFDQCFMPVRNVAVLPAAPERPVQPCAALLRHSELDLPLLRSHSIILAEASPHDASAFVRAINHPCLAPPFSGGC